MRKLAKVLIGFLFCVSGVSGIADILPVPLYRQSTDYSCGAASLLSLLYYWDVYDGSESALFPILHTDPKTGTSPENIVKGALHFGLKAELRTDVTYQEIREALDRKEPVIVDYQAWADPIPASYENEWDEGHYGVAVDLDEKWIYLMDPVLGNRYGKIDRLEFALRWHDIDGENRRLQRAAIFISGKKPADQYPLPITSVN